METNEEMERGTGIEETTDTEEDEEPSWRQGIYTVADKSKEDYPLKYTVKFNKGSIMEEHLTGNAKQNTEKLEPGTPMRKCG